MTELFIHVRFLDVIDIFLVAIIFYEIYKLVKGTVAFNIFMGIFIIFVVWLVVKSLKMELLGSILGQLFGVGVIAIIIVFQQESGLPGYGCSRATADELASAQSNVFIFNWLKHGNPGVNQLEQVLLQQPSTASKST